MKKLLALIIIMSTLVTSCQNTNQDTTVTNATPAVSTEAPATIEPVTTEEATTEPVVNTDEKPVVNIATLSGPTGISMAKLMEEDEKGTLALDYNFTVLTNPQEVVAMINTEEVDIASVPTNLAATLFNKTEGHIDFLGINTLGVLYILENGSEISTISDLKNKTIYATGQGSVPEYVLTYILEENGLTIGQDVFVEYMTEHAELATAFASGTMDIAMLPEPFVTTAMASNANLKIALSITDEWEKLGNGVLPMGGVMTTSTFSITNPDLKNTFIKEYEDSVLFTNENIEETSELATKFGIIPKKEIGISAIPKSNIVWIYDNSKVSIMNSFYEILVNKNPASIGGGIPGEDFYN